MSLSLFEFWNVKITHGNKGKGAFARFDKSPNHGILFVKNKEIIVGLMFVKKSLNDVLVQSQLSPPSLSVQHQPTLQQQARSASPPVIQQQHTSQQLLAFQLQQQQQQQQQSPQQILQQNQQRQQLHSNQLTPQQIQYLRQQQLIQTQSQSSNSQAQVKSQVNQTAQAAQAAQAQVKAQMRMAKLQMQMQIPLSAQELKRTNPFSLLCVRPMKLKLIHENLAHFPLLSDDKLQQLALKVVTRSNLEDYKQRYLVAQKRGPWNRSALNSDILGVFAINS